MGNIDYRQQITSVFKFNNDMMAVCDQYGKQIPFYQGLKTYKRMKQIKSRIIRQKNKVIEWVGFEFGEFERGVRR